MMQFSLISLIPGLIRSLQDCADPELDSYEKQLVMPTSMRTSERASRTCSNHSPRKIFLTEVERSTVLYGITIANLWKGELCRWTLVVSDNEQVAVGQSIWTLHPAPAT